MVEVAEKLKATLKPLLLVVLLTLSASYSFAECRINTKVDHTRYASGRVDLHSRKYFDFEEGMAKSDIDFYFPDSNFSQLFEMNFKGQRLKICFFTLERNILNIDILWILLFWLSKNSSMPFREPIARIQMLTYRLV